MSREPDREEEGLKGERMSRAPGRAVDIGLEGTDVLPSVAADNDGFVEV